MVGEKVSENVQVYLRGFPGNDDCLPTDCGQENPESQDRRNFQRRKKASFKDNALQMKTCHTCNFVLVLSASHGYVVASTHFEFDVSKLLIIYLSVV